MPATEQTWYNQKTLHVVFGLSSVAMFLATVWMFAADHDREWKGYQRRFRDIELRLNEWRTREARSVEQQSQLASLEKELLLIRTQPPARVQFAEFKREVLNDELLRSGDQSTYDARIESLRDWLDASGEARRTKGEFSALDDRYAELEDLAEGLTELRAQAEQSSDALAATSERMEALGKQLEEAKPATGDERQAIEDGLLAAEQELDKAEGAAREADARFEVAANQIAQARTAFFEDLQSILGKARFREEQLLSRRKFRSADVDAAKANLDLAVRDGRTDVMPELQAKIDEIVEDDEDGLLALSKKRQDATAHREVLQDKIREMTSRETEIDKEIEENQADISRLAANRIERRATWFTSSVPFLGKKWLELPILDGFGSPLKIDNLWTENLMTANGSFGKVRRFDRCTTCHKGIDKTAPGSAVEPLYSPSQQLEFRIQTPAAEPESLAGDDALRDVYGFVLASYGLAEDNDVAISQIVPEGRAAKAIGISDAHGLPAPDGLMVGDVILQVNDDEPFDATQARQFLTQNVDWGQPIRLTIRRGLPQPFTSHPRLDLFVGSLSPHSLASMACTVCHEGQGSATSFKWASHTPDNPSQEKEWAKEHGWFNNHHWILPMFPARFAESSCLKCHHDVADLEASPRFPDPPAPKLVEGWHLIGKHGCYGCHEINGYDGPDKRVGPDLRLEPNYYAAAGTVKADPGYESLDMAVQEWTETVIQRPFQDSSRNQLRQFLLADARSEEPALTPDSHKMAEVLQDQETPGDRRKAGPSLRFVAEKLGRPFLYDWIREPGNFRPSTQMPQFFELWDHLDGEDLEVARKFEKIEILGMVEYLLESSQPFQYLTRAEGTAEPSAERGKVAFETRGCLACHQHEDFPFATAIQGPNLTGLADKFSPSSAAPNGPEWLYSWIKRPTHYHARTKMPDLYLDPVEGLDGQWTDPVSDMVAYLLSRGHGWQPAQKSLDALQVNQADLDELVLEHLESTFPRRRAEKYIVDGIPEVVGRTLKGAEVELVGEMSDARKLQYVGRKAIANYGCHGCHDIPGFEAAKPIGTALADWGRKETSKLAFEHILEYLHEGGHGDHGTQAAEDGSTASGGMGHADKSPTAAAPHDGAEIDESFYVKQLASHERSGFIWQKLKEPRSYDYEKTTNKQYSERLRMPHFPIDDRQREAIVTFVLGLVADPPAEEFVNHPDPRNQALVDGRRVLEKYNCGGCHILEAEKWVVEFEPGELGSVPNAVDYPFLATHFSSEELAASEAADKRRGVLTAILEGMPVVSNDDGTTVVLDEEGDEIDPEEEYDPETLIYPFEIWNSVAFEGESYEVGRRRLEIPATAIKKKYATHGGDLAKWLLSRVVELEKETNPAANGTEAWSWLPPPLIGEGEKVQPEWLHSFLLEPYPIRPAVFLRMPKFNMSPAEATKIVNYFAARDSAQYPFEFDSRLLASHLADKESEFAADYGEEQSRLEHAMQIVTNQNYCIKCHLVGAYQPESNVRALAPDLSRVQARLRPEYIRRWIANPKSVLPFTAMPVNVPFDPDSESFGGVDQKLYPGSSFAQIDALVDLLMNYSEYTNAQIDVGKLVKDAAQSAADAAAEEAAESSEEKAAGQETAPGPVAGETPADGIVDAK